MASPNPNLTDTAVLGTPALPNGQPGIASQPPQAYTVTASAETEYVSGGYYGLLGNYAHTLPEWIDPVQRDFGLDVYHRMQQSDPQVASCIEVFKSAVLADGWRLSPAQDTDELQPSKIGQKPRRKSSPEAVDACNLCRAALDGMHKTPFDLFLRQMLDAMFQGHKVAEIVLAYQEGGKWAGKYLLDRIKPKPVRSTAFILDSYDNVVGLLGLLPNSALQGLWPALGFFGSAGGNFLAPVEGKDGLQKNAPSLLPRTKFAVLTWDGQDGSPQGRSVLRRAFTPWWWKEHIYAIWGKFIAKHADPSLVGTAAEGGSPVPDPSGAMLPNGGGPVMITPVQAMARIMAGFQNGTYMAVPFGAKIEPLNVANSGEAISLLAEWCNKEIAKAILGQTLATEEGKHGSRAQASVHENSKDDVTRYGQVALTQMVTHDILRLLVLQNYGPDAAHLIPEFGLGQEESMSYAEFGAATSALTTSGYLHTSQYQALDEMGGLPPRDEAAWNAEIEAKSAQREQALTLGDKAADATPGDKANEGQAVIQQSS